jgi:hypothetical protein
MHDTRGAAATLAPLLQRSDVRFGVL